MMQLSLALVHRAQNNSELAALAQIIRSQNPTRDWGKKAVPAVI